MKNSIIGLRLFSLLFVFLFSVESFSHILVSSPATRSRGDDGTKQDFSLGDDACDNKAPITPIDLVANSELQITFQETIPHMGYFVIQFSEEGIDGIRSPIVTQTQDLIRIQNEADPATISNYNPTVKVPNVNCQDCMIRVAQFMQGDTDQLYVQCIDVNITGYDAAVAAEGETNDFKPACGLIEGSAGPGGPTSMLMALLFLLPLMVLVSYKYNEKINSYT